ncbi:MAG TPA: Maf family protein [Gammaproteobacteria bacterium]|nr:Maf family protein [Gammaproteobacteria bacterium]
MSPQVYLASASPRRRELLEQIGVAYEVLETDVVEERHEDEAPEVFVLRMALAKARSGWLRVEDGHRPVLGADTAIVLDHEVLGKPRDEADGLAMLERLSGRSHHVYTGVGLALQDGEEMTRLSVSTVTFRETTAAERKAYWATGEPADKAGAYAVQGRGALFVERLEGSYSGVMGLPLYETGELLAAFGIDVLGGGHE